MTHQTTRAIVRPGPTTALLVSLCAIGVTSPGLWPGAALLAQTAAPVRPQPPGATGQPQSPAPSALREQRNGRLFPPLDLGLLEGPDREAWQKPDQIMDALSIADGAVVADLGAGGGWFTLRLARRVGPNGLVYSQDIQPPMIEGITRRVQRENLKNVRTVLGTSTDPHLPRGVDAVLIVDAYREMDDPAKPEVILTLLRNIARALKPQGRVGVVDFTPGGGGPGPSPNERVDPEAVIAAAAAAGLKLQARDLVKPFLFMLVFGKDPAAGGPL
jgi:ubiquinone/menaquinone biosynthesis C-methylase UbiE